jgi:hypothetical protein
MPFCFSKVRVDPHARKPDRKPSAERTDMVASYQQIMREPLQKIGRAYLVILLRNDWIM